MCGEQFMLLSLQKAVVGSPPRVRGTGLRPAQGRDPLRITPACAGNSKADPAKQRMSGDHPRVCGEQQLQTAGRGYRKGSPPRVRGTADLTGYTPPVTGITPACAGNRRITMCVWQPKRDHPRVCGEQPQHGHMDVITTGSPPRVRGTGRRV